MRAYRKLLAAAVLALGVSAGVFGQQITRIAVIDFNKIIASRSADGAALRAFEIKKSRIQAEIDKRAEEIKRLLAEKVEADNKNDAKSVQSLRDEIVLKNQQLNDFFKVKQKELDDEATALQSTDAFVQELYRQVQSIAEAEGYSLVLKLRNTDSVTESVFWYSPMIDITEKVIQALSAP